MFLKILFCVLPAVASASPAIPNSTMRNPVFHADILPSKNLCGPLSEEDRIVGGDIAELDEFPWLVRIKYGLKNGKEVYACAGSLITNRYIVTAAHCVVNLTIIDVRLGELNNEEDCRRRSCQPVDVRVNRAIAFPGYSSASMFKNDIALLRLEHDISFTGVFIDERFANITLRHPGLAKRSWVKIPVEDNEILLIMDQSSVDFIRPLCLPTSEFAANIDYSPDSVYWTAGWGQTEFEKKSSVKRKVTLEAVPMPACRAAEPVISDESAPYTICAGGRQGKDTCGGDSGGSLVKQVHDGNSTNWFLFGITSYGYKDCGTEGRPGLYTRVTRYMDWILHNVVL